MPDFDAAIAISQTEIDVIGPDNSGYLARRICPSEGDVYESYLALRYGYFVLERGWVTSSGLLDRETDRYDAHCHHLGVFKNNQIVACLRVLPGTSTCGLMLDHDFRCLLTDDERANLVRENSVELSRLAIVESRTRQTTFNHNRYVMELLLRLLYRLSLAEKYQHFYIEVETAWLKPFARAYSMPFMPICRPFTFPDGTETIIAHASLQNLKCAVKSQSRAKYQWYHSS